jgi:hypothetical protein
VSETVKSNMSLRKGSTFHSPSSTPDFKVPSLPRRSQSTLEDVIDAHKRRAAIILQDIDIGLSGIETNPPTVKQSFPDEADPIPRGFLDHTLGGTGVYSPIMDGLRSNDSPPGGRVLRPRSNRRPSRYADSGVGSSIASPKDEASSLTGDQCVKSYTSVSAITRSAAAHPETLPRLGVRASNRIHEHILKPILAKSSLKDFHPIVRDCPRKIHDKEIICLRDLEKTLMFMAPVSELQVDVGWGVAHWFWRLKERTKTAALYLDFCLTSIRCIQATVEFLNEREQTRPHDRPYSNGYFVDLVDQIKQYAQQVQAAKEKEENGEKLSEMDPESYVLRTPAVTGRVLPSLTRNHQCRRNLSDTVHSSDEVRLHGGLTKNGRPAELVRVKKNGKAISIMTGQSIDLDDDTKIQFKRSLSEEAEDDESILRSMARRKRSASAAELAPKRCREPGCDKEFKRPCDLTKHEKTHSRPWKCPVESCKYHEYGWPTEKEMDRHHNDKHSAAPPLHECHFKPCPYRSKRESNCKQHMEKAHGWEYVRSKNNGKNRDKQSNNGLPTPQTTNVRTPSSDGHNIDTPEEDDIEMGTAWPQYPVAQNQLDFPEYNITDEVGIFGANHQLQLDFSPTSEMNHSGSEQSPFMGNGMGQDQFQDNFQDFASNGVDFSLYEHDDLYSANVQLPTPNHEVFQRLIVGQYTTSGNPYQNDPLPHISPIGHGNAMLYTPTSLRDVDEGFSDDFVPSKFDTFASNNPNLPNIDFPLFPSSAGGNVEASASGTLFGEISSAAPNFPGVTAQELLDFYAASTHAATHQGMSHGAMDWSPGDNFTYGN